MSKNHRNRSWRALWTLEPIRRLATHRSGVIARVQPCSTAPVTDQITLENTASLDVGRWDLKRLMEQAVKLLREGKF